jgi:hypothetical protein
VRKAPGRPRVDGSAGRAARVQLGGDEGSFDMMEQIEVQKISYSKVQVFVGTRQQFRNYLKIHVSSMLVVSDN